MARKPHILLSMMSCLFALSASAHASATVTIDRLEASVNSSLILLSDIEKFRETINLRAQLDPLFAGTTVAAHGAKATNDECVQFMMEEKLITQHFPIADTEVDQEINSIQSNNHIDRSALKNALKEQGYGFDEYFELIRSSASKRNLIDRDIRTKVMISDDDVKNYFYNHFAQSSETPLKYQVRIITVTPSNYKNPTGAYDIAKRALSQIRAGETFEEVAKAISDHPSASTGGDLGILTSDQMSPAIRTALKKLQIGQVSDVLGGTPGGYFILKLVDVKSGQSDRYEKMKEEIRGQLAAAEYQHQISLWLDRQKQNSFIHRAGEATIGSAPIER